MTPDKILKYCLENLDGSVLMNSWGESAIFYNPNNQLKRGVYILTIKEKDGDNDRSSNLNRENLYRLNLGIRKTTFIEMFGFIPKRPAKGGIVDMDYDFTATNQMLPHPVYGWMGWVCCLNPSQKTFEELKPLIEEAYTYAKEKHKKRKNCATN
ncbi:DUF6194 family protein [Helicobacter sp. 11S02596-1]|uniref:DUF6194 family protein n=1 Tax=Helicobacter sp. 11S02596-1 TaxID=1476194 RepID=UPI000BA653B9|nr:DUF6194 family protein [Helicobacter sp. 11S02596-1]PAF43603.1 hypothetical protein BJI48_04940 [Helicobacter sp. 11S02596-1]